jgi:hypothetical protein
LQTCLTVQGTPATRYAVVNRKPEHHPEGVYHLRFGTKDGKQTFVPVGNDPYVALDKLAEKQRWLRDRERGVCHPAPDSPKPVVD